MCAADPTAVFSYSGARESEANERIVQPLRFFSFLLFCSGKTWTSLMASLPLTCATTSKKRLRADEPVTERSV